MIFSVLVAIDKIQDSQFSVKHISKTCSSKILQAKIEYLEYWDHFCCYAVVFLRLPLTFNAIPVNITKEQSNICLNYSRPLLKYHCLRTETADNFYMQIFSLASWLNFSCGTIYLRPSQVNLLAPFLQCISIPSSKYDQYIYSNNWRSGNCFFLVQW